ncbi:hypothetical protein [Cryptosporangium arvum]|uniref:hypothetical protein n=1 Tax=Cryptosporangium arvum TaxID=80871 RepID=UPI0004B39DCF|nr:hypothetical protein [Cryptosporangium arvum]
MKLLVASLSVSGSDALRLPSLRWLEDMTDRSVAHATGDGGWRRSAVSSQDREASIAVWKRAEQYLPI